MADVNTLLNERLSKSEKSGKMTALAQQSASGQLSGFTGIFGLAPLSDAEKEALTTLLEAYATDRVNVDHDLKALVSITSEVKAINNQAALLHGERIKKAHTILTRYRDGAFTAWLIAAYGNRQTPYNFWQYYEFYQAMPKTLRPQIEAMPRQAVYTLASREGEFEEKRGIVKEFSGQSKGELLSLIRQRFPLAHGDRRQVSAVENAIGHLERAASFLRNSRTRPSPSQRRALKELLDSLKKLVDAS